MNCKLWSNENGRAIASGELITRGYGLRLSAYCQVCLRYPREVRFTIVALLALPACAPVDERLAPAPISPATATRPATDAPTAKPTSFAQLALRPVVRGPTAIAPVPACKPPRLVVRRERPYYFGHTLTGEPPNLPTWMPSQLGSEDFWRFHTEPDGRSLAIAGNIVVLVDRDHHPEVGLDFAGFRSNPTAHSPNGDAIAIIDAHRIGQLVIALAVTNEPDEQSFLAAIDVTSAKSVWIVPVSAVGSAAPPDFVLIGDFAVLAAVDLVVRELGSGQIVARVKTAWTEYTLYVRPNGALHGIVRGLMQNGYTSELDVDVIR